jgi:GDP-L-fucose synthase
MDLDQATYAANAQPTLSNINLGTGVDLTIRALAATIGKVVGFSGKIELDSSEPNGTPKKLMNVSRLHALGWQAKLSLEDGLILAYQDYGKQLDQIAHTTATQPYNIDRL